MKEKVFAGTVWNTINLVATKSFQFLVQLLLTRMLTPEHYGLVGMAVVFTNIISVFSEMGVASALVRIPGHEVKDITLDTAFIASIAFNMLTYIIVAIGVGPLAAWFYDEPVLKQIIPVIGLSIIFNTLTQIPRVLFIRQLDFKRLSLIQIFPLIFAGLTSILMAYNGLGVWSLIANSLLGSLFSIPAFWSQIKWRPKIRFSKLELKEILAFGIFDSLQSGLITITKNIDYLIIGRLVGSGAVGYYNLAFVLTDAFRQQIMGIFASVMFPVYSKLQSDLPAIKRYYLAIVQVNTIIVSGIMVIFICFADDLIRLFFGVEWTLSAFPLQMMAIASIIHAIGGTSSGVLRGMGKAKIDFKLSSYNTFLVAIPGFLILTYFYGINGTSIAVVVQKISERLFYQFYLKEVIGLSMMEMFRSVWLVMVSVFIAMAFYYLFIVSIKQDNLITLCISMSAVFFTYSVCAAIFFRGILMTLLKEKKLMLK